MPKNRLACASCAESFPVCHGIHHLPNGDMIRCDNYTSADVHAWSIENWNRLPDHDRAVCLDHLRSTIMRGWPQHVDTWRAQAAQAVEIGSDDPRFHFGAGMAVRNILRQVLPDFKLPKIKQADGTLAQNWDDFYHGALHALATEGTNNAQGAK